MASKIVHIEAIPVRLVRDLEGSTGTAGTPNVLSGSGIYRWSRDYPTLYSTCIESALVKVSLDNGLVGWGESQAPLAPEVACTIIDRLLAPVLQDAPFDGTIDEIAAFWDRMYSTMRVRGQTGGFMLDAISGIDIALWDLAGKMSGQPIAKLIAGDSPKPRVPAYMSGLSGNRLETAAAQYADGFRSFKIYFESDWPAMLQVIDTLRERLPGIRVAVDALWHLDPADAIEQARELDSRDALWLECPLMPEETEAHAALARAIKTPIALGESYRTRYELAPLFRCQAMRYVQPDLGRCGITESIRIAKMAADNNVAVVPHLSIALGPQVAAAIHFAAAIANCDLCEYNPKVLQIANRYLAQPIQVENAEYLLPRGPGLGIEFNLPIQNITTHEGAERQGDLRALTSSLFTGHEEELRRIARELHDDMSQRLAALEIESDEIQQSIRSNQNLASDKLWQVRGHLGALADDVRKMSHRVYPSMIEELGLASALRALTEDFRQGEEMTVAFAARNVPDRINSGTARGIYRIAQEALRNVAKHAGKTHVRVTLNGTRNGVRLEVSDSGSGFDVSGRRSGLGLISMEERARILGGSLQIQSEPGHGTTVIVDVSTLF